MTGASVMKEFSTSNAKILCNFDKAKIPSNIFINSQFHYAQ